MLTFLNFTVGEWEVFDHSLQVFFHVKVGIAWLFDIL